MASIIDRFEGPWAVIEHDGAIFHFPAGLLPSGAREGDVITFAVSVDRAGTARRRRKARKLEDELFDRTPREDGL